MSEKQEWKTWVNTWVEKNEWKTWIKLHQLFITIFLWKWNEEFLNNAYSSARSRCGGVPSRSHLNIYNGDQNRKQFFFETHFTHPKCIRQDGKKHKVEDITKKHWDVYISHCTVGWVEHVIVEVDERGEDAPIMKKGKTIIRNSWLDNSWLDNS